MNVQDAKFSTKLFQFSVEPKKTFVDTLLIDGKKKQVGPATYKNLDPQDRRVVQEARQGAFKNGVIKSNTEQGTFIMDAEWRALQRPPPSKYNPNFVSVIII